MKKTPVKKQKLRRATLGDARKTLQPGDKITVETYRGRKGWSARASNLGQCWTSGHDSPERAAFALAVKILSGTRSKPEPKEFGVILRVLRPRPQGVWSLLIPKGWSSQQTNQTHEMSNHPELGSRVRPTVRFNGVENRTPGV